MIDESLFESLLDRYYFKNSSKPVNNNKKDVVTQTKE